MNENHLNEYVCSAEILRHGGNVEIDRHSASLLFARHCLSTRRERLSADAGAVHYLA